MKNSYVSVCDIVHLQRLDALFRAQRSEDLGAKHVMDLQYAMLRAEKTLNVQVGSAEKKTFASHSS